MTGGGQKKTVAAMLGPSKVEASEEVERRPVRAWSGCLRGGNEDGVPAAWGSEKMVADGPLYVVKRAAVTACLGGGLSSGEQQLEAGGRQRL
ncbi:hypothetical protein E2562_004547 [Oryza meyeriana var. granulata]|uniref:Uncharacterized protein n=1 Tax=Oryza meyeriana var. granulata TaxID=110450 RepID=A0A6G1F3K5_9ORYZ|nr:hypothetical protein E2562_004547 [Oryza meyeriana var. granulata]